ncbi:thiamine phosphate synthase [Thermodesulfobacteriota bacterium]
MLDKHAINWSLYLVTDRRIAGDRDIVDIVRAAIQGGATVVQMREKKATTNEMITLGRALSEITQAAGVPLIINDRIDVALAINADGVHVGPPDDMPASLARQILGPNRILGVSAESPEIARQAARDGADYIGVGDVYGTGSKEDAGKPIGLTGLKSVIAASVLPVVGIGGIDHSNAAGVIEAGADGVALISAVVGSQNPEKAARELRQTIGQIRRVL